MGQKIDSAAGGQSLQVKGGDPLAGAADEVEGAQSALEEMSERLARAEVKSAEDRAHLVDTALKSLRSLASCESPSLDRRSALWPHSNPTSLFTLPLSLAPSASLHLCPSFAHPFAPHLCPHLSRSPSLTAPPPLLHHRLSAQHVGSPSLTAPPPLLHHRLSAHVGWLEARRTSRVASQDSSVRPSVSGANTIAVHSAASHPELTS